MYDFDSLVEEVLKNKPELSRVSLLQQIEEKKNTVGSGYLTDQGALFLIAGELGVRLERITSTDLGLKDLYVGANDITVVARVFAIYPTNEYERKDGSGRGRYRRIGLFDSGNVARLTLWDDRVEDVDKSGITLDSPVRVVSGYVKQGFDGKPDLSLGRRGRIEMIEDAELSNKLDRIERVARTLGNLDEDKQIVALDTTLASEGRRSDFIRADGSPGSLLQFRISDGKEREERIAIWSPSIPTPNFKLGQRIRVTNLKARKSPQGEPELHGDGGSVVIPLEAEVQARTFRVVSTEFGETTRFLVVDDARRVHQLELVGDAAGRATSVKSGDVIRVTPDEDLKEKLVCRRSGSFEISQGDVMPELVSLGVKIDALKSCAWPVLVESIALSRGAVQEVHLKDGSIVKKGEIVIGDDTAEVKLIAWREQAGKVMSIEPGERVRVVGAKPQISQMGILTLQVSGFTRIERLRGR
jgi:ssDNA-binding replication factor A large subunit